MSRMHYLSPGTPTAAVPGRVRDTYQYGHGQCTDIYPDMALVAGGCHIPVITSRALALMAFGTKDMNPG